MDVQTGVLRPATAEQLHRSAELGQRDDHDADGTMHFCAARHRPTDDLPRGHTLRDWAVRIDPSGRCRAAAEEVRLRPPGADPLLPEAGQVVCDMCVDRPVLRDLGQHVPICLRVHTDPASCVVVMDMDQHFKLARGFP